VEQELKTYKSLSNEPNNEVRVELQKLGVVDNQKKYMVYEIQNNTHQYIRQKIERKCRSDYYSGRQDEADDGLHDIVREGDDEQ
jgi:hypothetical protein